MITIAKLKIYNKYNGDGDMWVRLNPKDQPFSDTDWALIASLLQDWDIIKNGLASNEYIIRFDQNLIDNFDNNDSIEYLKSMKNY